MFLHCGYTSCGRDNTSKEAAHSTPPVFVTREAACECYFQSAPFAANEVNPAPTYISSLDTVRLSDFRHFIPYLSAANIFHLYPLYPSSDIALIMPTPQPVHREHGISTFKIASTARISPIRAQVPDAFLSHRSKHQIVDPRQVAYTST